MPKAKPQRRTGGRPPAAAIAAYRDGLLDCATTVFIEHGYEAASMNVIAERAGASKMTLYRLFPSKAELFAAVMMRRIQRELVELDDRIREYRGGAARFLHDLGRDFLTSAVSTDQSRLRRVILPDGHRFPALARAFCEQTLDRVTQSLSAYFQSPAVTATLRIPDPDDAADVFMSLVIGLTPMLADMNLLPPERQAWIETRARRRVDMFLALYGAARSRPRRRRSVA